MGGQEQLSRSGVKCLHWDEGHGDKVRLNDLRAVFYSQNLSAPVQFGRSIQLCSRAYVQREQSHL